MKYGEETTLHVHISKSLAGKIDAEIAERLEGLGGGARIARGTFVRWVLEERYGVQE